MTSRVVTLETMIQIGMDFLLNLISLLRESEVLAPLSDRLNVKLTEDDQRRLIFVCTSIEHTCAAHGWKSTQLKARRIVTNLDNGNWSNHKSLYPQLRELRERLTDEFRSECFLHLEARDAGHYTEPEKGWEAVLDRFPKLRHNIIESEKCFALERYGASVFHILLLAEYGVIQLAKLVNVEGDRPGWGALQRLEALVAQPFRERSSLVQQHSALLENTSGLPR